MWTLMIPSIRHCFERRTRRDISIRSWCRLCFGFLTGPELDAFLERDRAQTEAVLKEIGLA